MCCTITEQQRQKNHIYFKLAEAAASDDFEVRWKSTTAADVKPFSLCVS